MSGERFHQGAQVMSPRHAERSWYEYALAFSRAPFAVRADTSKHYRCWMLRIARLHPQIGEKLDEMKASLTVCRHVAAGDGNHEQNRRAIEALTNLAERRAREVARVAPPDPGESVLCGAVHPTPPPRRPGERRGPGRPRGTPVA